MSAKEFTLFLHSDTIELAKELGISTYGAITMNRLPMSRRRPMATTEGVRKVLEQIAQKVAAPVAPASAQWISWGEALAKYGPVSEIGFIERFRFISN